MECRLTKDSRGNTRARWQCPLCPHHWDFHPEDLEHVEYFVIYHLASKHRLCGSEILPLFPELLDAVNECSGWLPAESR